jgi:acetylornithine deacetylase
MTLAASAILRELVAIPSVSALSNLPLLDAVAASLEPHGWATVRLPFSASGGIAKANLLIVPRQFLASLCHVELLFVCHTDTVPYRNSWLAATTLEARDGMLHGCGACDVKGALAGLMAAALRVDAPALKLPVAFALTADEEIGCLGATRLVASGTLRARQAIVCEPTSLRPATAGKGYGLAEVRVRGQEAHSAFPAKGVSAIGVAARLIVAIEELADAAGEPLDARFNPPRATFNVGLLRGGTAKNIVAGECSFLVEWRPLPRQDARSGGERLVQLAAAIADAHPGCSIEVDLQRAEPGFHNAPDSALGAALCRLLGEAETGISFGSEATRLSAIADEVVVIGPGDMETAHSERECVPLRELERWTDAVEHLLLHGVESSYA